MNKAVIAVEIEADTVEEAVKLSLRQLKAERENVVIEVLREEQRGLFGMPGSKTAKVKVSLKPAKK